MFTLQCNRQVHLAQLHPSLVCKFQLSKSINSIVRELRKNINSIVYIL